MAVLVLWVIETILAIVAGCKLTPGVFVIISIMDVALVVGCWWITSREEEREIILSLVVTAYSAWYLLVAWIAFWIKHTWF